MDDIFPYVSVFLSSDVHFYNVELMRMCKILEEVCRQTLACVEHKSRLGKVWVSKIKCTLWPLFILLKSIML